MPADLPTSDAAALGVWLLGLLTVLLIAERVLAGVVSWRKLRQPAPAAEATVTRAELDKLEAILAGAIQRLDDYTHRQTHDLRDLLVPLTNRLTVVEERTRSLENQFGRVIEKLDKTLDRIAGLRGPGESAAP